MRTLPFVAAVVAAIACTQPADPSQVIQGSWTLEVGHRALEPTVLTLRQFGGVVSGEATVAGLDPAGNDGRFVPVAGTFSAPTASLQLGTATGYSVHLTATMDRVDHLVGVLTFSGVLGGGTDTVSYVRH